MPKTGSFSYKRYVVAFVLISLLMMQVSSTGTVKAQNDATTVVEGNDVRFLLQEATTNLIPITSINSKWSERDVRMDGYPGDWNDAYKLTLLPKASPSLSDVGANIYVKNDKEYLYIGIELKSDKTEDAKGDWAEISFVSYGPMKQNSTQVVYHIEAIEKSSSTQYSVIKDGKKISGSPVSSGHKPISSEGGVFFNNNRTYELKVPLNDPALMIDNGILHMKLLINDASSGKKCQNCAWEIGLASSMGNPGTARSFKEMIKQDVVPLLDKAYETYLTQTKYVPYRGEKIDIKFTVDPKGGKLGNPLVIPAQQFLQNLASHNLPDTYLYPFLHALGHDFVSPNSALALKLPIASGFADLLTYDFLKQMEIPYDDGYALKILKQYESDKSPFAKLNWSEDHQTDTPYPTNLLMYAIFKQLLQNEGWQLFTKISNTELSGIPSDDASKLSLFIYQLDLSAGKVVSKDFIEKWKFPVSPANTLFDFNLGKIDDLKVPQGESINKQIRISLTKSLPITVSLSAKGIPTGAKLIFDPQKANPPFDAKVSISTALDTPPGSYPITVIGVGGGKNYTSSFKLDVIRIIDLTKMELKSDRFVGLLNNPIKFSTVIKSNQTTSTTNQFGLFIDNKLVTAQNYTLNPKQPKPLDFTWNSKGIDPTTLHTAQVKMLAGDKPVLESNKVKVGVFEPVKKGAVPSNSVAITDLVAKDPDTKKDYTLANVKSINVRLMAKGNYDITLVAPDGEIIIGKDGLINSPVPIKTTFELNKVKIDVMYNGYKASKKIFTVQPVSKDKTLPSGPWKIMVVGDPKGSFKIAYKALYAASPELSNGFK